MLGSKPACSLNCSGDNQNTSATSAGLGTGTASAAISAVHQQSDVPQLVTLSQTCSTGRTSRLNSSSISRINASAGLSPASMPPPAKQISPGAATCCDRRMTRKVLSRKIIATTPRRPRGFGAPAGNEIAGLCSSFNVTRFLISSSVTDIPSRRLNSQPKTNTLSMHHSDTAAAAIIAADPQAKLALQTIAQLSEAGFIGYLAGGCVRDALLDRRPKDYDVATNA